MQRVIKITKVAIVGSEEKYWTPAQRIMVVLKIKEILFSYRTFDPFYGDYINTQILVSGACPKGGVDIWAEIVADLFDIKKEIYAPGINQWEDRTEIIYETPKGNYEKTLKGYKTRNMDIATSCDVLYCIDPKWRGEKTGGKWTMRYAASIGKETHLVEIE